MNLAGQIEQYLPRQLMELVKDISGQAANLGQRVYLVGGAVRDLLLGYPSFDLDLVVEGDAVKLAQQVAETSQANLLAHHRFSTAKLRYENFTLDLATARKETYARPGALPAVTPGTLKDDLVRRDFSINAMAISLAPNDYGELIDPHQSRNDLEQRLIRISGSFAFCIPEASATMPPGFYGASVMNSGLALSSKHRPLSYLSEISPCWIQ